VTTDPYEIFRDAERRNADRRDIDLGSFQRGAVVQLLSPDPCAADAVVIDLHPALVTVSGSRIAATDGDVAWSWSIDDIVRVVHGTAGPWTVIEVPDIADFGVSVPPDCVDEFRRALSAIDGIDIVYQQSAAPVVPPPPAPLVIVEAVPTADAYPITQPVPVIQAAPTMVSPLPPPVLTAPAPAAAIAPSGLSALAGIDAREISAWFGARQVLDRVSLEMAAGEVTALIGPSGCGKSTFLRILNRMHEMIPSASMAGEVLLDGHDVYDRERKLTDARREIGMVFQKPNPFPAMSIYDNVIASLRLTGTKASVATKDEIVESCLTKAGLWKEVRDRLRQPGGGLSGGQQQRLCIARALAIKPRVLLMDEPCSALDPTSTRRIEETIMQLVSEVTIVIVTHNMQQAARVSNRCAFFLAEHGTPGVIVEHGQTSAMFGSPQDPRTFDYVNGRFG
jgi:phosphate transport system ATP-binding protein